jgi:hypothetical protein
VLVVHLKRFEYDHVRQRFLKISTHVKCGLELDLGEYVLSEQKIPPVYDLVGVANHHGRYGNGHYTAHCRSSRSGEWNLFNDERVSAILEDEVVTQDAYMFFFQRRGADGPPEPQTPFNPTSWPHMVSRRNSIMWPWLISRGHVVQEMGTELEKGPEGDESSARGSAKYNAE